MKKLFIVLAATLIMTLAATRQSFASFVPFSEFKIVGAAGAQDWSGPTSSDGLPMFKFDQTPYLYIKMPANYVYAKIDTSWTSPSSQVIPDNDHYQVFWYGRNLWLSLTNWNSVQEHGVWKVDGSYRTCLGNTGTGMASFVVTPEPMAFLLYGIGGLPLMARFIRQRKTLKS
jgi:hypothetical protein